ncbi:GMC oxidoreductase [Curvularia clavata]|uniref:GMC oxidoreductase n=1 Tax=Curvularia clavata TaxID=95742 RepID=A0A9Q8ZA56_CURCL|nr:GMC oxidoreductase [Curvularia clavata]
MLDSITGQTLLGSSFGIPGVDASFDFVVVGGGTAGLAVANRLSESGKHTVAILEAGGFYELDNGIHSQVPRYVGIGAGPQFDDVNPLVDWSFETEEEESREGQRMHYPRGRTLGGSSARNYLVYNRGSKGSYKMWADVLNDSSYEWENFKYYFDKSVTWNPADMTKRPASSAPPVNHEEVATSGPVSLSYPNWVLPFSTWAMKATEASGMKMIPGFIDGELIGTSWMVRTTDPKTMVRESSETAYLRPALNRPNLTVYHSTMAFKILFDAAKATGVLCGTKGKRFKILARKEVIISAGAFQSPQLLMVSGIGPKACLNEHNIPVVVEAAGVGQGMETAMRDFIDHGTGPLTSTGGDVIAQAVDEVSSDWPDVEYIAQSFYPGTPPDQSDYGGLMGVLVNTFSRGSISISSSDMQDPPVIRLNYLTDEKDKELIVALFRRMREILAEDSLVPILGPEIFPGGKVETDQEILKFVQRSSWTVNHVSCTCKMGTPKDTMAVVDAECRVIGTEGLRVVDVSAMPFLPPGHPVATVLGATSRSLGHTSTPTIESVQSSSNSVELYNGGHAGHRKLVQHTIVDLEEEIDRIDESS